jgi:hypothetical protein
MFKLIVQIDVDYYILYLGFSMDFNVMFHKPY